MRAACLALGLTLLAPPASAQGRLSHCIAIADATPGVTYIHKAGFRDPVPDYSVRISYVTHSSYLIQDSAGLSVITDYAGFHGNTDFIPDVVTMNHAHSSHFTAFPDPAIPHVLRGWSETFGEPVNHHLELGEVLIRNVSTDIRSMGGVEENGNSIFIFEMQGLCIGHLGHLHHEPNEEQYAAIGRLDVVMVPVDGGMTLDTASMVRVVERLKSSIVLPMHWFSDASLRWFLEGVQDEFDIDIRPENELVISLADLPKRRSVIVLRQNWLRDE
jgi:L-ascorbate metabolism protein UlaG (beta-lactamase superfamily)